jgi:signal transduction histidine kinase
MYLRQRSIRARVFVLVLVPLLALLGLYAFVAAITAGNAITLARATAVRDSIADPIGFFTTDIIGERILATVYLAAPTPQDLGALTAQEAQSNKTLAALSETADSGTVKGASPAVTGAMSATLRDAAGLPALRAKILTRTISRAAAQAAYSQIVTAGYNTINQAIVEMPNVPLVTQSLAVMRITEAADTMLESEALLVGDETARHFPAADHAQFARLVGQYQGMLAEGISDLQPVYHASFQRAISPAALAALNAAENAVINSPAGALPRVKLTSYDQAARAVAGGLAEAGFEAGGTLASSLHQEAGPIDLRLILVGGLGLLAIIVSVVVSVWIGRGLVRQLAELRQGALELAHRRLPRVMARLSAGEQVDIEAEAPLLATSADEIGQVRQAFNSVQRSAIEAAVRQARMRSGISTIFRNLARRSQALLHQQLTLLDDMERRATEPEGLEGLFRIDHLTTRMRRHAEGLVVLAGDRPGRTWTDPVPMADVLRAAVAEVVDYARIRVVCTNRAALEGRVVADAIHLIAELAENATVFSPPHTPVRIVGSMAVRGFAVEIEDRGLGMSDEAMTAYNATFLDPPFLDLPQTEQLGLYVAARLAHRHGISITLRPSPFGGTTAIVLIPIRLIVPEPPDGTNPGSIEGAPARAFSSPTGRHASRLAGVEAGGSGLVASMNGNGPQDAGDPQETAAAPAATGLAPWDLPEWASGNGADRQGRRPEQPDQRNSGNGGLGEFHLPRRIRQANLSPQLREPPSQDLVGGNGGLAADRSPDEIRDTLSAMQRGWERGRRDGTPAVDDTTAAGPGTGPANDTAAQGRPEGLADTTPSDQPPQEPPARGRRYPKNGNPE